MEVKDFIRIFVKGGTITPGNFLQLLLTAEKLKAEHIYLGSRQDIIIGSREKDTELLDKAFNLIGLNYEVNGITYQNIASSYVALDIQPSKKWLASHVYSYIFKSFDFPTKLRINIVDPSQSLVPLFTGQINYIASNQENYWYVYLRFKKIQSTPWQMPLLVYTEDLVNIAREIETSALHETCDNYREIFDFLSENVRMNTQPVTEDLVLPESNFPYYEGINKQSDENYWLGLYWRTNQYKVATVKAMMEHCIETDIKTIALTPWKSFIVKGISEQDRLGWEKLMGKFGMNLRHSSIELNWHIPSLNKEALDLKFYLVRELDKQDISTFGLTFTIKMTDDMTPFTSVVIEKASSHADTYHILHTKNFNQNLNDYSYYAKDAHKTVLASLILELTLVYYDSLEDHISPQAGSTKVKELKDAMEKDLYQCRHCMTVYDPEFGDIDQGIPAGTPFANLQDTYHCPTCQSKRSDFYKMVVH